MEDQIHCPKCDSTQLSANKKGFSGQKAVAGVVLTGGIGLLAGTIGSNKVLITCLKCGKQFKPGGGYKTVSAKPQWNKEPIDYVKRRRVNRIIGKVFFTPFILVSILFFVSDLYIPGCIMGLFGILLAAMAFVKTT